MSNPTFANRWNADVIDERYARWSKDPDSVDAVWRAFFEGFELAAEGRAGVAGPMAEPTSGGAGGPTKAPVSSDADAQARAIKQTQFTGALFAYRNLGHTQAGVNPLLKEIPANPLLSLETLGFTPEDLDEVFWSGNYMEGKELSLRELLSELSETYCRSIGVEYIHIQDTAQRRWLQAKMEPVRNQPEIPPEKKHRILDRLIKAEEFEHFLHKNFVGQKRFGLEGGETIIASLDALLEKGPGSGVCDYVIGMAHRGRLNVLSSILRKQLRLHLPRVFLRLRTGYQAWRWRREISPRL